MVTVAEYMFIAIGVARILSGDGALFLTKKADDLFLVVALKERHTPPNLTRPAKTVLKLTPALAGGCNSCP